MKNKLTLFLLIFCLLVSTTVGAQIREFERSTPEAEGVPSGALIALMDSLMALPKTDIHSVMVLRHGKVIAEMYPEPDMRQFSYAPLDTVMEGAFRPGHFNGVCQIVSKLFDAVKPDRAYFGEKDFQQLAIIREMVRQMNYSLEIVGCPIMREEDGLALSSRNARLSAEERKNALKISQTLFESRTFAASRTVAETQKFVEDAIAAAPGLRLEYFELVDGNTLQKIANWEDTAYAVGCITVFCGEVRLIDNIKYKE
mgnify:CR=1 FL=1